MAFTSSDEQFMKEALAFAKIAFSEREVPIGAVVVRDGKMIGRGRNRREALADPTHHAEIEAIREAAQAVGSWRLDGTSLDRKSTRLNSSHVEISYAVFCLKKK